MSFCLLLGIMMKRFLSILIGKIIIILSKITGHKGSSIPGKWAYKIDKDILTKLSREVKRSIIVVCGTNGKTTTNNMIEQILRKKNYNVVCNKVGANMHFGVITAFIAKASLFSSLKVDFATIEVDELSTLKVFEEMIPDYFLLTNLFRDQLDRYGEIDIIIKKMEIALSKLPKSTIYILNGDDPLSSSFGYKNNNRTIYFGIEKTGNREIDEVKEGRFCPFCGEKLQYNFYHYSQLGDFYCNCCNFERPLLDYEAKNISLKNGISFDLISKGEKYLFDIPYKGFYNIYNIISSVAAVQEIGIDIEIAETILQSYETQVGRMEKFFIKKPIFLNLSKNPAGFNQAIETVLTEESLIDIFLILNDNSQDGEDISWIWDGLFEKLNQKNIDHFYISGTRGYDMALRLKYSDIPKEKISVYKTLEKALEKVIEGNGRKVYILVNYTALFETQKRLKYMEKKWSFRKTKWKDRS